MKHLLALAFLAVAACGSKSPKPADPVSDPASSQSGTSTLDSAYPQADSDAGVDGEMVPMDPTMQGGEGPQ